MISMRAPVVGHALHLANTLALTNVGGDDMERHLQELSIMGEEEGEVAIMHALHSRRRRDYRRMRTLSLVCLLRCRC
jgi:hypothetical protein